ncbi:MAG TPA: PHP domain-containing protein [Jiangellaceae bacterium]|nr:PHP domain-containing protein [Jiangellaceae bacterium]
MRIDLHTHSSISDGTDRPDALVRQAAAAGLDVLALTDHDTFDGWAAAMDAAEPAGITVVGGVEMSTTLHGAGVHVLGYLPDPAYRALADELARIRTDRTGRIRGITERLRAFGVQITVGDVLSQAGDASSLGRPHVADALVAKGYARNRAEAFTRWLAEGGPAFVRKYAPTTATAIALIRSAGGVPVLAHPWGRSSRPALSAATIEDLAATGLAGLEVDHDDHDPVARDRLRELAVELGLVVTGSSDHHGTGKAGHRLGTNTTARDEYERLIELAAAAAGRAGRPDAPRPVGAGAG